MNSKEKEEIIYLIKSRQLALGSVLLNPGYKYYFFETIEKFKNDYPDYDKYLNAKPYNKKEKKN